MKIKAIQTKYNSHYFRSRLEARWAVLFDNLGIQWTHEIVGFDVGGDRYLPDFYIPDWRAHIEIKPSVISRMEAARLGRLYKAINMQQGMTLMVIKGEPSLDGYDITWIDQNPCRIATCRRCDKIGYVAKDYSFWGLLGSHRCGNNNERQPLIDSDRIMQAYEKATKYKFDHKNEVIRLYEMKLTRQA